MENVSEAIKNIEEQWKSIYETCKDNPSVYQPYLQAVSLDDVGETVLTVLAWLKRIGEKKRNTGSYRIAKGLLFSSLEQTIATLKQIASGQYNHFPTLLTRLSQTFVSLFPLTVLSTDHGEEAFAVLGAQYAEQFSAYKMATEKLNSQIDILSAAEKVLADAQSSAEKTQSAQQEADVSKAAIDEIFDDAKTIADGINALKEHIETDRKTVQALASKSNELETAIANQQEILKILIAQATEDQQTIRDLLPQATSAGLASAFAARAETVAKPQKWWLLGFAFSLILLCGTVIGAFIVFKPTANEDFIFAFIRRFSFAAPWVWSAWFCARNYGHSARLQEVYSFKETASRAFEGYKKQMLDIGKSMSEGDSRNLLVEELSVRVMKILSKDPLNVFDRKSADETPFNSIIERLVSRYRKEESKETEE